MLKNDEKLNILISCSSYSWGGLEMETLETAQNLKEFGFNIKILCTENSKLMNESNKAGIETIPLFTTNSGIPSSVSKLKQYLRSNEVNIIHSNHSHDLWVLTPALNQAKSIAKLFLTKHMASGVKKKDMLHKYLYKRVDKIFAISNYIRQSVIYTCPIPQEKVYLLPLGIDMKKFSNDSIDKESIKKDFSIPEGKLLIGISGRMTPGKGHEDFLNAACMINKEHFDSVHFAVIGSASYGEENYEIDIRNLSNDLGISNITFTGYTPEPEKLMGILDILAVPSHNESFGRVLLEAMALKVPVAASGNAGIVDIVVDNETGLLFEPKNPRELAEKLILLKNNPELRKAFSENGYKRAKDVFSIEKMTEKLIEFYTN